MRKDTNIYLNNTTLETILGIYFDKHIENISDKSFTLIHMLGRSAKLNWGLGHKPLKT